MADFVFDRKQLDTLAEAIDASFDALDNANNANTQAVAVAINAQKAYNDSVNVATQTAKAVQDAIAARNAAVAAERDYIDAILSPKPAAAPAEFPRLAGQEETKEPAA